MIYKVAELRTILDNHSYRIRESLYDGKPAQKSLLGVFKTNRPVVKFNGDDSLFMLGEKKNGLLKFNITAEAIIDFLHQNTEHIGVNKKGELMLKKEMNNLSDSKSVEDAELFRRMEKLKGRAKKVQIVAFDDKFSDSELVYAVGINE